MSKKGPESFSKSVFKYDEYYEFEAPHYTALGEESVSVTDDEWFKREHPLHSPGAARKLKLRNSIKKQAAANKSLRFTPKRALVNTAPLQLPVASPGPSPGHWPIAKKLTFPSPAPSPAQNSGNKNASRKRRGSSSVRVVGSGPFSEARQKKVAKQLVLDETESNSQPDLVTAAMQQTGKNSQPQAFDATARRLLFQLSPNGPTMVTAPSKKKDSPPSDIFADLEKLSISSASKSKKRVLTSTPPRSIRIGGSAVRVAPGSNNNSGKNRNYHNEMFPEFNEPAVKSSAKRGRVAPPSTAGAAILSKMVSKKTGSSQLRLGGASRSTHNSGSGFQSSSSSNSNHGSSRSVKLGVEHIVAWEKRSGKSWYKLSRDEKEREIALLKENLRN